MHFQFGGYGKYAFKKNKIHLEGGCNNIGIFNTEQMFDMNILGNVACDTFEIHIPKATLEDLSNQYPQLFSKVYSNFLKGDTNLLYDN